MSEDVSNNILIACVGNIFLGDDGFGVEVARALDSIDLPEQAAVVDFGIRGLDVAYALLDPWRAVVIVDAMARGGSPGDLYLLEIEPENAGEATFDPHSMDPARALALARTFGEVSAPIYVVGCEPAVLADQFEGEIGLSAPVSSAIPEAARMIERLIRRLLPEGVAAA